VEQVAASDRHIKTPPLLATGYAIAFSIRNGTFYSIYDPSLDHTEMDLRIILGGIVILYYLKRGVSINPSKLGKICTVTQMAQITSIMINRSAISLIFPAAPLFLLFTQTVHCILRGIKIDSKAKNL